MRYLLAAGAHYRKPVNYSEAAFHAATESVGRLADFNDRVRRHRPEPGEASDGRIGEAATAFEAAMDDDLNLPEAMGAVFTLIRTLNRELDTGNLSAASHQDLVGFLDEVEDVLGVLALVDRERERSLSPHERSLLHAREEARSARLFAESDRLRVELAASGVIVEDTSEGQRWRRW